MVTTASDLQSRRVQRGRGCMTTASPSLAVRESGAFQGMLGILFGYLVHCFGTTLQRARPDRLSTRFPMGVSEPRLEGTLGTRSSTSSRRSWPLELETLSSEGVVEFSVVVAECCQSRLLGLFGECLGYIASLSAGPCVVVTISRAVPPCCIVARMWCCWANRCLDCEYGYDAVYTRREPMKVHPRRFDFRGWT